MADIKRALRNIPEKQAGEEPANEGQKGYLRRFGYFSEKLIKDLGTLQSSYLIDQAELIKEEGSANIDASQKKPRKLIGFVRLIFLLAVLFLVIVMGRKFLKSGNEDATNHSESESERSIPEDPEKAGEQKATEKLEPEGQAAPATGQLSESVGKSSNLALIQYPVIVVASESFDLLNNEGKETPIAAGTPIKLVKRSELGTLTMEIGGKLFVGNESRLLGKIRLE